MAIPRDTFRQAFKKLPHAVRNFISSPEAGDAIQAIAENHHLDAAKTVIFDDAVNEMLLGITSPQQLPDRLTRAGITPQEVTSITSELNDKIFKPLQEKFSEKTTGDETSEGEPGKEGSAPKPVAPAMPQSAAPVTPAPRKPEPLVSAPQLVPPSLPPHIELKPIAVPPKPVIPPPVTAPRPAPTPVPPTPPPMLEPVMPKPVVPSMVPQAEAPHARTMASDIEAMQKGMPIPAGTFQPKPMPEPAPAPKPVAPAVPPVPPAPTPGARPQTFSNPIPTGDTTPASPNIDEVTNTLKQYGIDPYREPIE